MIDQGIVSLGNFGMGVLLARYYAGENHLDIYGAFWVLMELLLLLNATQAAMACYPLTVRGAASSADELRRLSAQSVALTLAAWPLFAATLVITALVAKLGALTGLWASVALVCWQVQETFRRGLMAHLRFAATIWGDAVSYLGQVALVALLIGWGHLTLDRALGAIALTSLLGAAVQAMQLRVRTRHAALGGMRIFVKDCWMLGRWVLAGNLLNFFSGVMFNWNLAYWAGLEVVGTYYAILNLLKLANPLVIVVATLITPAVSAARRDLAGAVRIGIRYTAMGAALLGPYLALLVFWPWSAVSLVYGDRSPLLEYEGALQVLALSAGLVYIAGAAGALFNGVEQARLSFITQIFHAVIFVLVAMPLAGAYELTGAAWGTLIAAALRTGLSLYLLAGLYPSDLPWLRFARRMKLAPATTALPE